MNDAQPDENQLMNVSADEEQRAGEVRNMR